MDALQIAFLIKTAYVDKYKTEISNVKLQKLLYFTEAQWMKNKKENEKLFDDDYEAWLYGPVIPKVYREFKLKNLTKEHITISENDKNHEVNEVILEIIQKLGKLPTETLIKKSHVEDGPWYKYYYNKDKNSTKKNNGYNIIDKSSIKNYFSNNSIYD